MSESRERRDVRPTQRALGEDGMVIFTGQARQPQSSSGMSLRVFSIDMFWLNKNGISYLAPKRRPVATAAQESQPPSKKVKESSAASRALGAFKRLMGKCTSCSV